MRALGRPPPKKSTNLTVSAELLARARQFDINLSATLECALIETLQMRQRDQWKTRHRAAIDAYNARVDEHSVFSDGLRSF